MKLRDILIEQKLEEKPMGFLKSMGNKAMAALGSGKAQGRVETGTLANQLRKKYDVFLGKTGQDATADSVIEFLKGEGIPTAAAEKALAAPAPTGAVAGAVKGLAKGAADIAKAGVAGAKAATAKPAAGAAQPAAAEPGADQQPDAADPQKPDAADKAAIAARVRANVGKSAAATKASAYGGKPEQSKTLTPSAFGKMAQDLTKPLENPPTANPAAGAAQPAADQQANPAARPQGGGRQAGGLSMTPNAIKKRQNRAVKKRTSHPADDNSNIQLGQESIVWGWDDIILEELSGRQLDAVFMAAAQDAARAGIKPDTEIGAAQAWKDQMKAGGGIAANLRAGAAGDQDGSEVDGTTEKPAQVTGAGLTDESGVIPQPIMDKINQLNNRQRQQLLKELG